MRRLRCLAALAVLAVAACGEAPEREPVATVDLEGRAGDPAPAAPAPTGATAEQLAALDNRDCRVVAEAFFDAVARGAFAYAELFWDDPVIDDARLAALFSGYVTPRVKIADVQEEGAAGTLYCRVTGALVDASDPRVVPRQGKIVLRRANDVPGASTQQLRWTIVSSTFIEPMERSGRGEIA